jgi:hypothetical protein
MKNPNLTNVIVTIVLFTMGWLFVPSPFHKCPKVETIIVYDTLELEPNKPEDLGSIEVTSNEIHPVDYQHIEIEEDSTGEEFVIDLLVFTKETDLIIPADSSWIVEGKDTLGIVVLNPTNGKFRSTTYYTIGDSIAQTIHEVIINPRPIDIKIRPIVVDFEVEPRPIPEKPIAVLKSPFVWGLLGAIVGAIVTGLIVKNKKD